MPKTIIDDNGDELEVFTAEELEAQKAEIEERHKKELEDKEAHVQEKLSQFKNKENGIANAESEAMQKAEEAKALVESLQNKISETEKNKQDTIKNFYIQQVTGGDAELSKKLMDAYELINMPINSDGDIANRIAMASKMIDIKTIEIPSSPFPMGGMAPQFNTAQDNKNGVDHEAWKAQLGL
jgi:DNA repair exonuclease SbcCD ATPase subunit